MSKKHRQFNARGGIREGAGELTLKLKASMPFVVTRQPPKDGRIDNACGASPATLHLFESRMKPRRNAVMQAHVVIVGERSTSGVR